MSWLEDQQPSTSPGLLSGRVYNYVSSSKLKIKRLGDILLIFINTHYILMTSLRTVTLLLIACVCVCIHNDDLIYNLILEKMQGSWDNKTFYVVINYTEAAAAVGPSSVSAHPHHQASHQSLSAFLGILLFVCIGLVGCGR